MLSTLALVSTTLLLADAVSAHTVAWTKGMYCKNGLSHQDAPNAAYPMEPLFNETFAQWFMHGPCRNYPPPAGEFLELPAGGSFTAELSPNRAFTSLSYNGSKVTGWGDGQVHADDYSAAKPGGFPVSDSGCIFSPNIHCKSQADAAGTVFAIAYTSDISKVRMSDLTVFTVAPNTPYKIWAKYDVPADMPECPPGGCICAWGWVPNHCGQGNVYMNGYRCKVTGAKPNAPKVGKPKAPVWCEDDRSRCVKGPKQMVIYWQKEANTIDLSWVKGFQKDGEWPSPGYNWKMGFGPGAQNDIFETAVAAPEDPTPQSSSAPAKPASSSTPAKPASSSAAAPAASSTAAAPASGGSSAAPASGTTPAQSDSTSAPVTGSDGRPKTCKNKKGKRAAAHRRRRALLESGSFH